MPAESNDASRRVIDYATPPRRTRLADPAVRLAAWLIALAGTAPFFAAVADAMSRGGLYGSAVDNASLPAPAWVVLLAAQVAAIVGRSPRLASIVAVACAALAMLAAVPLARVTWVIALGPPPVWTTPSRGTEAATLAYAVFAGAFVARANDRWATRLRRTKHDVTDDDGEALE